MEKEHFEILMEQMQSNFQLAFEKFDLVDKRFEGIDKRFERMDGRFDGIEIRIDRLEAGQKAIIVDVRDIKRTVGLLHSIANDHEARLQNVETTLRNHLDNHS